MARLLKGPGAPRSQARILTALAATNAIVSNEIRDSNIINSLARRDSGSVSVGEKAVALV